MSYTHVTLRMDVTNMTDLRLTDVLSTRISTTSSRDPDQPNYCNVKLPAVQSLADIDADTVARLIISTPIQT